MLRLQSLPRVCCHSVSHRAANGVRWTSEKRGMHVLNGEDQPITLHEGWVFRRLGFASTSEGAYDTCR